MPYRQLILCVEGTEDEIFFRNVVGPHLERTYDYVRIILHALKATKKCSSILNGVRRISGTDLLWVCDSDKAPCVTVRKDKVERSLPAIVDHPIVVVVKVIESWFLAGVDTEGSRILGIRSLPTTDSITKEAFSDLRPSSIETNREFMLAILEHFSVETAQRKNRSFRYFCQKYLS